MDKLDKTIKDLEESPKNVRFSELKKICDRYFGQPRNKSTSHHVYQMPWKGDPRINIQKSKGGKAKPYQVKQVIKALEKLLGM